MSDLLSIRDWAKHFENNRTKELKAMTWIPVPVKLDGDGYTELLDHENGAAHFGAWIAILEVAARCETRGTLLRGDRTGIQRPHDSASLSRLTRLPAVVFEEAIPRLIAIGWLLSAPFGGIPAAIPHTVAVIPQLNAVIPQVPAGSQAEAAKANQIDDLSSGCGNPAGTCGEVPSSRAGAVVQNRVEESRGEERQSLLKPPAREAPVSDPGPGRTDGGTDQLTRAREEQAENVWIGDLLVKLRKLYPEHRWKEGSAPAALFGACRLGEILPNGAPPGDGKIGEAMLLERVAAYARSDEWTAVGGKYVPRFETFLSDKAYLSVPPAPGSQSARKPGDDGRRQAGGHATLPPSRSIRMVDRLREDAEKQAAAKEGPP